MTREEHARENLIAEATALVERIELQLAAEAEPLVAGFRSDGSASLFFGDDPVYQFNARRQLRRAFVAGLLYKAKSGRLVEMTRSRQAGQLQLISRELTDDAAGKFIATLHLRLDSLIGQLESGQAICLAEVPGQGGVAARLSNWLAGLGGRIEIADAPNAG